MQKHTLIRTLTLGGILLAVTGCAGQPAPSAAESAGPAPSAPTADVSGEFARLEEKHGARLGVYALDTGTGDIVEYRADERFAYASTMKALAAAAVLDATDEAGLQERLTYDASDLVVDSPVTAQHVATGLTVEETIIAAIQVSDNTAGNLLFGRVGGVDGLEGILRGQGDDVTALDRLEPELNEWAPGETRDTSTPRQMADDFARYVVGDELSAEDRAVLLEALRGNTTGDKAIRAAAPEDAVVGDKTGTAEHGTRNDIAIVEPAGGDPVILAIYSNLDAPDRDPDDALIAGAADIALGAFGY